MIPPILHQTWKTDEVPEQFRAWGASWQRHNPGWTRMFWSDRTLLEFVAEHYPDFLGTFSSYRRGILRADAGRYLLLHHFGGVYADIDCECVASFEPIMGEERAVLCREPQSHYADQAGFRGLPYLLFNGTMASPPGHPFWLHLLSYLPGLAHAKEAIDATGPAVMTSAQLSFADQALLSIRPPALFTPLDRDGNEPKDSATNAGQEAATLSIHHWAGTWWSERPRESLWNAVRRQFYKARYLITRGAQFDPQAASNSVDRTVVDRPPPSGEAIAILVPLRDAAEHIAPFLAAIQSLDYPMNRIKLVFCEGDSQDSTWQALQAAVEPLRAMFRDIVLLQRDVGTKFERKKRAKPRLQRQRRVGLAKVRNHLIRHGLDDSDDWALWVDIDVWRFPADVVRTMIGTGHRIVVPNCVRIPGGDTFDLNSFVTTMPDRDYRYYRSTVRGLYQPPADFGGRLALSDVRHLEKIEMHGVGGTMLLVDASLHRGGLLFPEKPYRDYVETEGFGVLARDLGVAPLGLPRVEIVHVPW
ncbi:MAG: glycosyltransferase [Hyphomicrobiales bacterium]|nr:glycosyltransferase [Hyphomicrobiales bacterium]